ncbi:glycosyltransferase family 4 protein [Bradyrhizobium ganzhouense]|uniref:glycosyltransferase family 4 protein n=1 Tax=Bradyrhizobium ganzhouense TaxID=1179767 RepID=UPI003CE8CE31
MKVAIYVPSWPPGDVANGIVTYAKYLVPALRQLGHEVFVLSRDPLQADGHTIDISGFRSLRTIWYRLLFKVLPDLANHRLMAEMLRLAVTQLVQDHGVQLLEIEESFGWGRELVGACGVPVIVRLHGPWFLNKRSLTRADAKRELREEKGIRTAQALSSPSSIILNAVASQYGIPLANAVCVPNPIDCVPDQEAWGGHLCLPDSILFVGRFDAIKGGDLIVQAFTSLARGNPNLSLTFVGTDYGILQNGSRVLFEQYARRCVPDDLRTRLRFLGPIPHAEVSALRKKHFLTVCTSRSEIFPYSVLEAMAYGCPIVATDVGGIPEMIASHRNGILCRSGQLQEIISAIQMLLDDKDMAAKLGKQARLDCNNNFNSTVVAEQVSSFYRSVIDAL